MMHVESRHCAHCGKPLIAIHKDMGKNFVGNTFTGMYQPCECLSPHPSQEAPEQGEWMTAKQIERVIKWMNTWEQLKDTVIPIRFKEDFTDGTLK